MDTPERMREIDEREARLDELEGIAQAIREQTTIYEQLARHNDRLNEQAIVSVKNYNKHSDRITTLEQRLNDRSTTMFDCFDTMRGTIDSVGRRQDNQFKEIERLWRINDSLCDRIAALEAHNEQA